MQITLGVSRTARTRNRWRQLFGRDHTRRERPNGKEESVPVVFRHSSTSHLLSRIANSNWVCWHRAGNNATGFVCGRLSVCSMIHCAHRLCRSCWHTIAHARLLWCLPVWPCWLLGAGLNDHFLLLLVWVRSFCCLRIMKMQKLEAFVSTPHQHIAISDSATVFTAPVWLVNLFSATACLLKEQTKLVLNG